MPRIIEPQTGPAVPETHQTLVEEPWAEDPAIRDALEEPNAELQLLHSDGDPVNYDEYSITIDEMPPGVTPEAFLGEMMGDLNGVADSKTFNFFNEFERREPNEPPHEGEIVDIKFPPHLGPIHLGPNGSVMLTEIAPTSFTYSTVTNKDTNLWMDDTHPINGSREFGFERNDDGSITFYTRAATNTRDPLGWAGEKLGAPRKSWESLMDGIGKNLESKGAIVRPDSRQEYRWAEMGVDPRRGRESTTMLAMQSINKSLAMQHLDEAFARLQSLVQ